MEKDTYTIRIVLIPMLRNNLQAHSFEKQKNIPHDKSEYNTLIKYERVFDRGGKSLKECWFEANKYMSNNIKSLFTEKTETENYELLGYRYVGYYYVVELNAVLQEQGKTLNIWIK